MNRSLKPSFARKIGPCLVLFVALFGVTFLLASTAINASPSAPSAAQRMLYPCGLALLISGLGTLWLALRLRSFEDGAPVGRWFFPILSALLAFIGMSLAYIGMGIWPVGIKTGMIVDMHHQYAPLLAGLRESILSGSSPLYSFEVGLGMGYLPVFGYYLASPFNLLLLLFPESLLAEGLLVITLLKNALTAALFCAAVQYLFGKRTYASVVVSLMYSMMMYLVAYSWNIMWLDGVMLLPLCVLGLERLMREGKPLLYILSLAYALYSNYYIGFMICLFLVLYYVAFCVRQKRSPAEVAGSFMRFSLSSLAGGLLAMFLLVPVAISLGRTSAAGGEFQEFSSNFPLFDLLQRQMFDVKPTIRSGNLPNLYCGVLAAVTVPLFATTKAIPLRRRIVSLSLLGVMALSLVVNNLDLLWHGLHAPNDLPYRFSFLYSFVLLLIAAQTLLHVRELSRKQLGASCVGLLIYLVVSQKIGEDSLSFESLYISLALVLLYTLLLALGRRKQVRREASYALLLVAVTAELVVNTTLTFDKLNSQEYFTAHAHYVDNDVTEALRQSVASAEALGDAETDHGFYRMEFAPRRTSVDTALFGYRGITSFASSGFYEETRLMGSLGYAVNGVNSHLFRYFVPLSDSLLGIRYVTLSSDYEPSPYLVEKDRVTVGSQNYVVYENTLALPLGFLVRSDTALWNSFYYHPFLSQNTLLSAMTGDPREAFVLQQVDGINGASVNGVYSILMQPNKPSTYSVTIASAGHAYLYVDCRAAQSISAKLYRAAAPDTAGQDWSITHYEPYIIDLGALSAGDRVEVTMSSDIACSGNVYVAMLDEEVLSAQLGSLQKNGWQVTSFSDTRIEGSITADQDGAVFTSIPFDEGWSVTVDGVPVETYAIGKAMLSFDVTAGTHHVAFSYFPEGLALGLGLTALGVVLTVVLCLLSRRFSALTDTGEALTAETEDDGAAFSEEAEPEDSPALSSGLLFGAPEDADGWAAPGFEATPPTGSSEILFARPESPAASAPPPSADRADAFPPAAHADAFPPAAHKEESPPLPPEKRLPSTLADLLADAEEDAP